jgi:hypothetical protein
MRDPAQMCDTSAQASSICQWWILFSLPPSYLKCAADALFQCADVNLHYITRYCCQNTVVRPSSAGIHTRDRAVLSH